MSYLNIVGVGDALDYLKRVPDCSVDSCCTDGPYGLGTPPEPQLVMSAWMRGEDYTPKGVGFMGGSWDAFVPGPPIWREVFRVLKPGGWLLSFFGTRTYDWGTMAIRFAGFDVTDTLMWVYGCLDDQTEVLTHRGWVHYRSAREGDLALCYDVDADAFSWGRVDEVFTYEVSDPLVALRGDRSTQLVTGDHRCLVEHRGAITFQRAASLQREVRVPVLETLPELLAALPVPQLDAGQTQQDLRTDMRESVYVSEGAGETEEAYEDAVGRVRHVRQGVREAECVGKTDEGALLFDQMQRQAARRRTDETRTQGQSRLDGRVAGIVPGEDVWREQPSLERRGHLLQGQGELRLRRDQVCAVPAGVQGDGAQGRLRDGAQAVRCAGCRPPADQERDRPSRRPRSDEQRAIEPDAVRFQPGAQTVRGARFTGTDLARVSIEPYEGVVWCIRTSTGTFVARRPGGLPFITGNSGFPKSLDISKAIDNSFGADRETVGSKRGVKAHPDTGRTDMPGKAVGVRQISVDVPVTAPATEEARAWQGWGTAMKPAHEPICMARKPFAGTYAENVLKHGTGALNIEASRIGINAGWSYPQGKGGSPCHEGGFKNIACESSGGRWPANVILSHLPSCKMVGTKRVSTGTAVKRNLPPEGAIHHIANCPNTQRGDDETYADADGKEEVEDWECAPGCPVAEMDQQSGNSSSPPVGSTCTAGTGKVLARGAAAGRPNGYGDAGGASRFFLTLPTTVEPTVEEKLATNPRFFYTAKAANKERWSYCKTCKLAFQHDRTRFEEHKDHDVTSHPTQKPLALMEYLVRLVTQEGGVVLDPFCGTGSTAVAAKRLGFNFVTCDLDENYALIARARLGLVGREAGSALTSGAYFCPGCKAKGEIKLIAKEAVDRMRESGRKTTCMKCMKRYTFEEMTCG